MHAKSFSPRLVTLWLTDIIQNLFTCELGQITTSLSQFVQDIYLPGILGVFFLHSETDFFHWLLSLNLVIRQFMLIQCVKKKKNRNDLKYISVVSRLDSMSIALGWRINTWMSWLIDTHHFSDLSMKYLYHCPLHKRWCRTTKWWPIILIPGNINLVFQSS